jgi:hypothetical protein
MTSGSYIKDAGLTYNQLNDDALGRALEKLATLDKKDVLSAVSLVLLTAHSVQCAYENGAYGQFRIEYAYGNDHRVDLKKFKIGPPCSSMDCPCSQSLWSARSRTWYGTSRWCWR